MSVDTGAPKYVRVETEDCKKGWKKVSTRRMKVDTDPIINVLMWTTCCVHEYKGTNMIHRNVSVFDVYVR